MSETKPVIEIVESTPTQTVESIQPEKGINEPKSNSTQSERRIENDTSYAALVHIGGIFFSFVPSLIAYLCIDSNNSWLKDQAKEALNFQISMAIYWAVITISFIISIPLMFIIIGFLLALLLGIISVGLGIFCLVCPIIAACSTAEDQPFNNPLTIRFLK
jgi:uncharacterized protein